MHHRYSQTQFIAASRAGADTKARLSSLLAFMQDCAANHAAALGVGYQAVKSIHRAFVLSRIEIHINRELPTFEKTIQLTTWPRKLDRILVYRDYTIHEPNTPEPFLTASSAWLLIDTQTRRPARPHDTLLSIELDPTHALTHPYGPTKVQKQTDLRTIDRRRTHPSDLDPNGHVNNTRYVDWITDALANQPEAVGRIGKLSIHFLKEIRLHQEVDISLKTIAPNTFYLEGNSDQHCHFNAEITLK